MLKISSVLAKLQLVKPGAFFGTQRIWRIRLQS